MKKYIAEVLGEDYFFEVSANDHEDAHATAVEFLQLAGSEEWIEKLSIKEESEG